MLALLLFTHTEFLDFIKNWLSIGFGAFTFFYVRYKTSDNEVAAAAKKERQELTSRLGVVEDVQKTNTPRFLELIATNKLLEERVTRGHEIEFAQIKADLNQMRISYEQRFLHHEQLVEKLEQKMDKLGGKMDTLLMLMTENKHR